MIKRLMPDFSLKEQCEAQADLDQVIAVLYRICDRMVREDEERDRQG